MCTTTYSQCDLAAAPAARREVGICWDGGKRGVFMHKDVKRVATLLSKLKSVGWGIVPSAFVCAPKIQCDHSVSLESGVNMPCVGGTLSTFIVFLTYVLALHILHIAASVQYSTIDRDLRSFLPGSDVAFHAYAASQSTVFSASPILTTVAAHG